MSNCEPPPAQSVCVHVDVRIPVCCVFVHVQSSVGQVGLLWSVTILSLCVYLGSYFCS